MATVTPFAYTGLIFCPTVSTGAFVARRNGKVFVTGNSGFPKSHDVSKAIDKAAGADRERGPIKRGGDRLARLVDGKRDGNGTWGDESGRDPYTSLPATDAARQWQGWGTALKPAWEPVIVARKPLVGTVAENVQRHGTGAINVDGCRVGTDGGTTKGSPPKGKSNGVYGNGINGACDIVSLNAGRWPANVIHDGSEEAVGLFPVTKSRGQNATSTSRPGFSGGWSRPGCSGFHDQGSAARFFYCAKASKADRDEGCEGLEEQRGLVGNKWTDQDYRRGDTEPAVARRNHHPTVKPTALMRYLCRLVTPPGGLVLDPFCGSGSTGKAAVLEGFRFVGIEREAEYVEIAKARIAAAVESVPPILRSAL